MATFEKITEEPSHYDHLEQMSVHEILTHINEEDHRALIDDFLKDLD